MNLFWEPTIFRNTKAYKVRDTMSNILNDDGTTDKYKEARTN